MSLNQQANATCTHTYTHITSLVTWSFSLFPRESLTWVRAIVHPVLPTFIRPLTLSRHVHSSPRMWKPILACHLLTVTHIINRKSSRWLPRALNTSGEPLSARQTFFTNEAKTLFRWMQGVAVGLLVEGIFNSLYVNTNILNILLSYYTGCPLFLTSKANNFSTHDDCGIILPWRLTRNLFHCRVIYCKVLFDVWRVERKICFVHSTNCLFVLWLTHWHWSLASFTFLTGTSARPLAVRFNEPHNAVRWPRLGVFSSSSTAKLHTSD